MDNLDTCLSSRLCLILSGQQVEVGAFIQTLSELAQRFQLTLAILESMEGRRDLANRLSLNTSQSGFRDYSSTVSFEIGMTQHIYLAGRRISGQKPKTQIKPDPPR